MESCVVLRRRAGGFVNGVDFFLKIRKIFAPKYSEKTCFDFMNELQTEIAELKEFIAELKNDRAATKEKEKREAWTKYVSLSVVIIAVIAAIAAQWGGKYSSRVLSQLNDATYNQSLASDQWAFYQAKSIKLNSYEIAARDLGLGANPADANAAKAIADYKEKVTAYRKEQEDIKAKAQEFEAKRDAARAAATVASGKGGKMGMAISFFSVAVALASICMVTKKKPLWFAALILAAVAVTEMALAWLA
jgi:DNA repair exonuclease SbcCD ATPase subunit